MKTRSLIWLSVIMGLGLSSYFLIESVALQASPLEFEIPSQSDWVDYGKIFEAGELGTWDYQLFGGFTNSIVKRDGIFYLYYQGASGYRSFPDETVLWRAIGLATSEDGLVFTKSSSNPVISWHPNNNGEEGAVSAGVALGDQNNIIVHYGANTEFNASLVNADVRAAISQNGQDFKDIGTIIQHGDPKIWGSRDEIFPIISINADDRWIVYYLPNGIIGSGRLGVAWGDNYDRLMQSRRARSGLLPVNGWGTGSSTEVAPDKYALFINNIREGTVQAYLMSPDDPASLSLPLKTYRFDDVRQASIYLDKETRTWFMFYRGPDYYGVKIASAGKIDHAPPIRPVEVQAEPIAYDRVHISWQPTIDSETGVAVYKIYRDGENIATVKGFHYEDTGLYELTAYQYQIQAVDYHGVASLLSKPIQIMTLADISPPEITSVSGYDNQVIVTFNEPVSEKTATTISNYELSGEIEILKAELDTTGDKIFLATEPMLPNKVYSLVIKNLTDRADHPNLKNNERVEFVNSAVPNLVGEWNFGEGEGNLAIDRSNYGNDGDLIYINKPGPKWVEGIVGSGLQFDGLDDQIQIPQVSPLSETFNRSFSIALWVKPENTPQNESPNDEFYSIFSLMKTGLFYTAENRFTATVIVNNGESSTVTSEPYQPNVWHQLVMVVDANLQQLSLYVDAKPVDQSPKTLHENLQVPVNEPVYLGTSDPLEGRYENRLHGILDQVKIFSTALTTSDVETLYNNERP